MAEAPDALHLVESVGDVAALPEFDTPIARNTRRTFLAEQQVLDVVGEVRMISELLLYERDQLNSTIVGTGAAGFNHGFWILS